MIFIFQFVDVVHHIVRFADIEESLLCWDKSSLIIMYDPLNIYIFGFGLLSFSSGFLRLCSSMTLVYNFLFCDIFVWFWYQGDGGLIE